MFRFKTAATTIKNDKMWGVLSRYFITGYIVKNMCIKVKYQSLHSFLILKFICI